MIRPEPKGWPAAFADGVLKRPRRLLLLAATEAGTLLIDAAGKSVGTTFDVVMWAVIIACLTVEPWISEERAGRRE